MVNIILGLIIAVGVNGMMSLENGGMQGGQVEQVCMSEKECERLEDKLKEIIEKSLKELESVEGISSQNKVLEVKYEQDILVINLDSTKLQYGGGTYLEYMLGAMIMEAVFENSEIDVVSILMDGQIEGFPEGSDYSYCTRAHYEQYYKNGE